MSTLGDVWNPSSSPNACHRCLSDPEAGGDLLVGARRPLHFLGYFGNVGAFMQSHMISVSEWTKMVRVHAGRVVALVMQHRPRGYRSMRPFVEDTMGFSRADDSISTVHGSGPQPARRFKSCVLDREARLFLAKVVAPDVVLRFALLVSSGLAIDWRRRGWLPASALAKARRVVDACANGPRSINVLKVGDCH